MKWFKKISSVNIQYLSGPAVDAIISTVKMMQSRQDFDEQHRTVHQNSYGWTSGHAGSPVVLEMLSYKPGDKVPISTLTQILQILAVYQKTQVSNFATLQKDLRDLYAAEQGSISGKHNNTTTNNQNKVKYIGKGQYNKEIFQIPNLSTAKNADKTSLVRKINNEIKKKMTELYDSGNTQWGPQPSAWGMQLPVYKAFSLDKTGIEYYGIHPTFIKIVSDLLGAAGYDISEFDKVSNPVENNGGEPSLPKIELLNLQDKSVDLKIPWLGNSTYNLINQMKSVTGISHWKWNPSNKVWTLRFLDVQNNRISNQMASGLAAVFKVFKLDGDALIDVIKKFNENNIESKEEDSDPSEGFLLRANVVGVPGSVEHFQISLSQPAKNTVERQVFDEIIKFSFPQWANEPRRTTGDLNLYNPGEVINGTTPIRGSADYKTVLRGRRSDFSGLINSLKIGENVNGTSYKFNTSILEKAVNEAVSKGMIKENIEPGKVDGFEDENGNFDKEKFNTALKTYDQNMSSYWRNSGKKKELYPLQKDAISRIYSHPNYILGDDVGVGKTVQLIASADLRLQSIINQNKDKEGRILIITLVSTKEQFKRAICETCGYDDRKSDVPVGFNIEENKKWTVLSYSQFANGTKEKIANLVKKVAETKFTVAILDELHKVKNDSTTSNNILSCVSHVPYRWGATATLAANKPIDILRQLKAIGHPLGNLSPSAFKAEFGGMKPEYNPYAKRTVMVEGTPEEQKKAAHKLSKWLAKSGVYEKKTKEEVRPELIGKFNQESFPVKVDTGVFSSRVIAKMTDYKDPELAISEIIAEREVIANMKVPYTVEQGSAIIADSTKKLVVFTCFGGPMEALKTQFQSILDKEGEGRKIAFISGGQSKENRQELVDQFKGGVNNVPVLIVNVRAGGTGLDLPDTAEVVLHNDFEYSPADEKQAQGRAKRISNTKAVMDRYIIAADSPDEFKFMYVMQKMEISEIIERAKNEAAQLAAKGLNSQSAESQIMAAELQAEKAMKEFQAKMEDWRARHIKKASSKRKSK